VANTDLQVGDFMKKLKDSPIFKDVNLIYTESFAVAKQQYGSMQDALANIDNRNSDQVLRKFQIELMLSPSAEVVNPANPNSKTTVEMAGKKNGTGSPAPTAGATAGAN